MTTGLTFKANLKNGEAWIRIASAWLVLPAILRADLLKDWIACLSSEYDATLREMQKEFDVSREARKMTTVLKGRYSVQAGKKLKKIDTANVSQKLARKAKADRTEKRLRANRERSK